MSLAIVRSVVSEPMLPLDAPAGPRTARAILHAWRAGKSPRTLRSYEHDLDTFAGFLTHAAGAVLPLTVEEALTRLFAQDSASAHHVVLAFRASLERANLAPASINRALAALRSVSKLARMLGIVNGGWYLDVAGVRPSVAATPRARRSRTSGACSTRRAATRRPRRATTRSS